MAVLIWITDNYIEIFGAVAGIVYVFLEIRQSLWLWPVGIITSAVYIWVFFTSKLYADMSLQGYYLVISFLGWYWWVKGRNRGVHNNQIRDEGGEIIEAESFLSDGSVKKNDTGKSLQVTRLKLGTAIVLTIIFGFLYIIMWQLLDKFTDSPVPGWDSFITSLSIIGTWMLARKIYEHWFIWIAVNSVATVLFLTRELYPTVILYLVYGIMSFAGLVAWKHTMEKEKILIHSKKI